jgi:amino acid transporter
MEATEARAISRLGNKQLSTVDCVAQSMAVGPIFSAVALGGILAGLSGGVSLFVLVITTIGILAIGWIVSELAKRYSGSGTVYEAIAHTLGKPAGVFAAMLYHLAITALVAGIPVIGGIFLKAFCAAHLGFDPPWWVAALVIAALVFGFNALGIQVSVKTQLSIIVASAIPLLVLFVAVVVDGGPDGNNLHSLNPGNVATGGSVFKGVLFAILMFIGFEWSAALGEETANPKHSIPRAVLWTVGLCATFYFLTQYTLAVGGADFVPLADAKVGHWLGVLIELAVLFDIVAVGVGIMAAAARGLFTIARDGLLPAPLATTNRKDVPMAATGVVVAAMVVVVLLAMIKYGTTASAAGPDAFSMFLITSTIGGMLICLIYGLLCIGGLRILNDDPRSVLAGVVGLVTAIGGIFAQFITGTAPTGDALWGRHIGLLLVALVAVWLGYNMSKRRDKVTAAAGHALQH